jgi:hypothetical protein
VLDLGAGSRTDCLAPGVPDVSRRKARQGGERTGESDYHDWPAAPKETATRMKMRQVPEDYYLALVRLWNMHDELDRELDDIDQRDPRMRTLLLTSIAEMDDLVDEIRHIRRAISDAIREGIEGK